MCRIAVERGHRARGRAGDGHAARRARARAARPRRDRARLRAPTSCCSTTSRRFRASLRAQGRRACRDVRRRAGAPAALRDTMRCAVAASSFAIAGAPERVRVIEIEPGQLITARARERADASRDGARRRRPGARPGQDRRDRAPPRDGPRRARARARLRAARRARSPRPSPTTRTTSSSSASTTRDMALCAARAQELGGGLVVARDGAVRGELALPVAGLLSDAPVEEVAERPRGAAGPAARAGRGDRRAVHDAVVPRAVGDPVAEDHRPRAGRRRRASSSCRCARLRTRSLRASPRRRTPRRTARSPTSARGPRGPCRSRP